MKIVDVTRMSPKGQVVIPKEVRDLLKMTPGRKLAVGVEAGRVIMEPLDALSEISRIAETLSQGNNSDAGIDRLVDDAVKWARKKKGRRS